MYFHGDSSARMRNPSFNKAITLAQMGFILTIQRKFQEARNHLLRALKEHDINSPASVDAAVVCQKLGEVFLEIERYNPDALEYFKRSAEISQIILKDNKFENAEKKRSVSVTLIRALFGLVSDMTSSTNHLNIFFAAKI